MDSSDAAVSPGTAPIVAAARPDSRETVAAERLIRIAGEALPAELAHIAAGPMAAALAKAVDFAQSAVAPRTEKIYADTWAAFRSWCEAHEATDSGQLSRGRLALPAAPAIVAAYLAARQETLGRSGLRLVLAAIAYHHRRAGVLWSGADPVITTVMRGILRAQQRPVRPAAALTSVEIKQLLSVCDDGLIGRAALPGLRDRALLLTCFAGGLRRSELVALDVEDLTVTKEGLRLRIRRSKSDQKGEGAEILIARGLQTATCPVRAMELWLQRSRIDYGAVFPRLTAAGTIETRLTGNGVWRILRRRAQQAGLEIPEGERLSPHGMRAGFITEAYLNGALDEQVMAHARQKDVNTTRRYRKRAKTVAASPTRFLDL
jgi:integrase